MSFLNYMSGNPNVDAVRSEYLCLTKGERAKRPDLLKQIISNPNIGDVFGTRDNPYLTIVVGFHNDLVVYADYRLSLDRMAAKWRLDVCSRSAYIKDGHENMDSMSLTYCFNPENIEREFAGWRALPLLAA